MRKANFRRLLKFVGPPSTDALESPILHPGFRQYTGVSHQPVLTKGRE